MVPFLPICMTIRETQDTYEIPRFRHSEEYLSATRNYRNQLRSFETAVDRMEKRGKTVGRTSKKRTIAGSASGETVSEEA